MDAPTGAAAAGGWRPFVIGILVAGAVAIALLLLTALVPTLRQLAIAMSKDELASLGRPGLVVAGLLAPLVYVFKKISEWLVGLLSGIGRGGKDDRLEQRTNELEAELKRLRGEVADLDRARARELEAERARAAELQRQLEGAKRRLGELDAAIAVHEERLADAAPATADEIEAARRQVRERSTFVDVFARPRD